MDAILNFFKGIGDAIVSLFDMLIGFVADIVYLVKLTGSMLAKIPSFFSWLPESMVALILVIIAVVVLYKILGREG